MIFHFIRGETPDFAYARSSSAMAIMAIAQGVYPRWTPNGDGVTVWFDTIPSGIN
jgi:hypothetical protein